MGATIRISFLAGIGPQQLPAILQQAGRNRFGKPPLDSHRPGTIRVHLTCLSQDNPTHSGTLELPLGSELMEAATATYGRKVFPNKNPLKTKCFATINNSCRITL
jgi:hypothetical protein